MSFLNNIYELFVPLREITFTTKFVINQGEIVRALASANNIELIGPEHYLKADFCGIGEVIGVRFSSNLQEGDVIYSYINNILNANYDQLSCVVNSYNAEVNAGGYVSPSELYHIIDTCIAGKTPDVCAAD